MNNQVKSNVQVKRGEIWFVDFGTGNGRVQGSRRPGVVISNKKCNENSPVITMVALTSNVEKALSKKMPTQVFIGRDCGLQSDSIALCEQIRSVDKSQLDFKVGEVDEETMILIEKASMIQLGVEHINNLVSNINNQVINVTNVKFDIEYTKELLLSINELTKISKELNKPIITLENKKIEFIAYCKKFNRNHKEIVSQIKIINASTNVREMSIC